MANLLETGMIWLADQGIEHFSAEVVYTRDGLGSVTVNATFGSQLLRLTDSQGIPKIERTERDFGIRAADLVIAGTTIKPQRGDHIDVTIDDMVERFDVMSPLGEPAWRYSDAFKKRLRIHSKLMSIGRSYDALLFEDGTTEITFEDGETVMVGG